MTGAAAPADQLAALAKEYRPSMNPDVLHAWAADVVAALKAGPASAADGTGGAAHHAMRQMLAQTTAVAITMLYDSHKRDVVNEFSVDELEAVTAICAHLRSETVESIYRRAFDMSALADQAGLGHSAAS